MGDYYFRFALNGDFKLQTIAMFKCMLQELES